jgi:Prenyltransferase and squalene oxidase repeat
MRQPVRAHPSRSQGWIAELQQSQNRDGGWGFRPGAESRMEPTAWALIALSAAGLSGESQAALDFVANAQLKDGSWAAAAGEHQGCWVTALACWALRGQAELAARVSRALRWLGEDRPGDARLLWRMSRKLVSRQSSSGQRADLYGWSWTPGTASWVEPTCYALLALRTTKTRPFREREQMAEAMLYDRMCLGGGWNCGNPRVYGVAGQPQVGPTVWALLALRHHFERAENQLSLAWLVSHLANIRSPESLALAEIALAVYDQHSSLLTERLCRLRDSEATRWTTPAICWTVLALSGNLNWLPPMTNS